jgi:hypothetical protein
LIATPQWSSPGAADYKTDPANPTGFWPDYLEDVAAKLGEHYGKTIVVERKYYDTSVLVVSAVAEAEEVDMSEPYYYISGFHGNLPRTQALAVSCATAGTASAFYTNPNSNITTLQQLVDRIEGQASATLGFIGQVGAVAYYTAAALRVYYWGRGCPRVWILELCCSQNGHAFRSA